MSGARSKYVPPHLRNASGGGQTSNDRDERDDKGGKGDRRNGKGGKVDDRSNGRFESLKEDGGWDDRPQRGGKGGGYGRGGWDDDRTFLLFRI